MNSGKAVSQLSALAHDTRLAILRLLVRHGRDGLPAGEIGRHTGLPASRLSFHLSAMENAGLIRSRRESRNVIYAVRYASIRDLFGYLMEDCCGSHPKVCEGLGPGLDRTAAIGGYRSALISDGS